MDYPGDYWNFPWDYSGWNEGLPPSNESAEPLEPPKLIEVPAERESLPSKAQPPTLFVLTSGKRLEAHRLLKLCFFGELIPQLLQPHPGTPYPSAERLRLKLNFEALRGKGTLMNRIKVLSWCSFVI
jgi:hypothetical protein